MMMSELRLANAKAVVEYWQEQCPKNRLLHEFGNAFLAALDGHMDYEHTGVPDSELGRRVRASMRASNSKKAIAPRNGSSPS